MLIRYYSKGLKKNCEIWIVCSDFFFCEYFLSKIDFLAYVVELLVWMTAAQFIEHKKSPEYKQVHPTLNNNMISTDYLVNFQIQHYFFSLLVFLKWLLKDDEH